MTTSNWTRQPNERRGQVEKEKKKENEKESAKMWRIKFRCCKSCSKTLHAVNISRHSNDVHRENVWFALYRCSNSRAERIFSFIAYTHIFMPLFYSLWFGLLCISPFIDVYTLFVSHMEMFKTQITSISNINNRHFVLLFEMGRQVFSPAIRGICWFVLLFNFHCIFYCQRCRLLHFLFASWRFWYTC